MTDGTPAGAGRIWVPGDWNGFFGLFTNVLLNVIVLTGLCLGVVLLPADTVFGRILPALGVALPLGNLFYAYLAWQLGTARWDDGKNMSARFVSNKHVAVMLFFGALGGRVLSV